MNFCESFTHRKKRPSAGDAGASSDLAFLLIIYFIVIAGFNINKGFILHLPAKDSMRHVKSDALLRFELDDTGSILFRGNPLAQPAVEDLIRQGKSANPQLAVALVISTWTPWQDVVSFVQMAQKLEIAAFSFSMKEPAGGAL